MRCIDLYPRQYIIQVRDGWKVFIANYPRTIRFVTETSEKREKEFQSEIMRSCMTLFNGMIYYMFFALSF